MPRKFKVLSNIGSKGLQPDNQGDLGTEWATLDNVIIEGGNWRKRPGLIQLSSSIPSGTAAAKCKIIEEFNHSLVPTISTETDDPNGDDSQEEWTLSAGTDTFAMIDDGASNDGDTTYLSLVAVLNNSTNSAVSEEFTVTFPNLATAFIDINTVDFEYTIRDLADETGINRGTFFSLVVENSSGIVVGGVRSAGNVGNQLASTSRHKLLDTTATYRTFRFSTTRDPFTNQPWTVTAIDGRGFGIERFVPNIGAGFEIPGWRLTNFRRIVTGTIAANRLRSKIFVSNTDWLRMENDLVAFTDIDAANIATIATGEDVVWDSVEFNNAVYFTNGVDDVRFYPDSTTNIMATIGGALPVGRCLGSFGARLFQGDITDASVRTKTRLQWSAINDATDWTSAASGNLDLDETPGAIIALEPFTEARDQTFIGVLVVLKDDSIFHIEATGVASDPFDKRVMNSHVGIIARHSVQQYVKQNGLSVMTFLGVDNGSVNIFEWNGDEAVPIGTSIIDTLMAGGRSEEQLLTHPPTSVGALERAWAVVDPSTNHYILGIPGSDADPAHAWVYDIDREIWSTQTFDPVTMAGTWQFAGERRAIYGRDDSLAYWGNPTSNVDTDFFGATEIPVTMRTGVMALSEEPNKRSVVHRIWLYYKARTSAATYVVRVGNPVFDEVDGGSANVRTLTTTTNTDGRIEVAKLDFLSEGHVHVVEISAVTNAEEIEIEKIVIEYEEQDTFA